jgi:hypothetical protein
MPSEPWFATLDSRGIRYREGRPRAASRSIHLGEERRMEIPQDAYQAIEHEIAKDDSPVGIDAKKTHIMILHHLREIDERLKRIEIVLEAT